MGSGPAPRHVAAARAQPALPAAPPRRRAPAPRTQDRTHDGPTGHRRAERHRSGTPTGGSW
ncbi:hypothetical protein ACIRP0_18300 [Streptomyces sp. NPDC101733]|uniref:hypothetical protein n=1 Tax=unclassified Streptomyces TaxID=2593676 RepID=UPI00382566D1